MESIQRRGLRVLRLVHELHKQGFQLLRIVPGMSPSGCHWRCTLTPKFNILRSHGAMFSDSDRLVANYTTGQDNEYFGWTDAKQDDVKELAVKFAARFPEILNASLGDAWVYAGWYVRMLGYAEREMFPISYSDCGEQSDPRFLPLLGVESSLLMPPPGDAEDRSET